MEVRKGMGMGMGCWCLWWGGGGGGRKKEEKMQSQCCAYIFKLSWSTRNTTEAEITSWNAPRDTGESSPEGCPQRHPSVPTQECQAPDHLLNCPSDVTLQAPQDTPKHSSQIWCFGTAGSFGRVHLRLGLIHLPLHALEGYHNVSDSRSLFASTLTTSFWWITIEQRLFYILISLPMKKQHIPVVPLEIWMYLTQKFLSKDDTAILSLVSSPMGSSVLSLLFSHLTFYGRKWEFGNREPLRETIIHLHYSHYRINGLCKEVHLLPHSEMWTSGMGFRRLVICQDSASPTELLFKLKRGPTLLHCGNLLFGISYLHVALPWLQQLSFTEVVRYRPLFLNPISAIRHATYGVSNINFNVDTVD